MPKVKDKGLPAEWIKNYPELAIQNNKIFCRVCIKMISIDKKYNVVQHVSTLMHKNNLNKDRPIQKTIQESIMSASHSDSFAYDLCDTFVSVNIPLRKLDNPKLKIFLEKYCQRSIPSESSIRKKYLNEVFSQTFDKIKREIGNNFIWFTVDETTDSSGRYIANLLIGILHEQVPTQAYLISSKQLERTNHSTIARFVQEGLANFYLPNSVPHEKVILMLSDAAAYMIKAGTALKVFYENLIHCTCLAHGLSRVAETVRQQFPLVNELIKNGKKIFVKAPLRVQAFRDQFPDTPLPPEPVLTRWGTWLEASLYYASNYEKFKSFVCDLDGSSTQAINDCQKYLNNKELFQNLTFIKCNYWYINQIIKKLEAQNLPLAEAVTLVTEFHRLTNLVKGSIGLTIKKKLDEVLDKNEGFKFLSNISKILEGSIVEEPPNTNIPIHIFKFAPITSVDVERSFSIYKTIFSDRRQNFTSENLEKILIVNCYSKICNN